MIVFAGILIGAITGVLRARSLKGNRLDQVQYAAAFAIAFGIAALFVTIFIVRMT